MFKYFIVDNGVALKQYAKNKKELDKVISTFCKQNRQPFKREWFDEKGFTWVDVGSWTTYIKYKPKR